MKERERVLELVKKGILTSEEALILLENMATEKDEKQIEKAAEKVDTQNIGTTNKEDQVADLMDALEKGESEGPTVDSFEENTQDSAEKDRENLERILDELATKANRASAELDEVNAEIAGIKEEIKEVAEEIGTLDTKEELDALTEDEQVQRKDLHVLLAQLEEKLATQSTEKTALEEELKSIRKEQWKGQWNDTKEKVSSQFSEEWKDQATDTFNQVGGKVAEVGGQVGEFLKKTFNSFSDTMNDNVEWKDIKMKVPGVATTKFEHEFNYPNPQASLIDVKVANGTVVFKTWDQEDVKVEAKIKLYGKMAGDSPMEAFLERSDIDVDDETISFQVPNKRVKADLTFYLPKRTYDHVSVKLLNGNVLVEELTAKDVYTKSTNGTITFKKIDATMLEIEGVNGEIKVLEGTILDNIIETVNGDVSISAAPESLSVSLINGDIRITAKEKTLRRVEASSANGNIKLALPNDLGVEGQVKTNLGSINSRLTDIEVVREKKDRGNQQLHFRRVLEESMAQINASTTTGSIFLKDTDK
ncbi:MULTISPECIES: daptomycin-sensing surface protein LiaX [Enterococcus]|uniref:daptomycin-sensing surface protein LiaX n=1 Tax=Enterococcus TaxID=1350 RepID=UPI003F239D14